VNLERAGYAVEMAFDGAEALAAIRRTRPDLVVTDIVMPEMDGFELLSALRRDPDLQDIPCVVLGNVAVGGIVTAASAADLLATIRRLLGENHSNRGNSGGNGSPPLPPSQPMAKADRPKKRRDWWEA
jgi:DNA-binding response OmpR family regulator